MGQTNLSQGAAFAPSGQIRLSLLFDPLCDREIPGLDWPYGLAELRHFFRPPTLVLLSDPPPGCLSQDVIRYGGFDILFRPLCQERLVATVELAHTHWDMRLDPRTVAAAW